MKLHNLITSITEAQAVQYYSSGDKNVVAYYDGEYYSVDNFGVFDLEEVHFMYVDYQSLDLIKLLDWLRSSEDTKELVNSLYSKDTFTNMSRTSSIKQEITNARFKYYVVIEQFKYILVVGDEWGLR